MKPTVCNIAKSGSGWNTISATIAVVICFRYGYRKSLIWKWCWEGYWTYVWLCSRNNPSPFKYQSRRQNCLTVNCFVGDIGRAATQSHPATGLAINLVFLTKSYSSPVNIRWNMYVWYERSPSWTNRGTCGGRCTTTCFVYIFILIRFPPDSLPHTGLAIETVLITNSNESKNPTSRYSDCWSKLKCKPTQCVASHRTIRWCGNSINCIWHISNYL